MQEKNYKQNTQEDFKNVLSRYYKTAIKFKANNIVRITADGILADPKLIDKFIKLYEKKKK